MLQASSYLHNSSHVDTEPLPRQRGRHPSKEPVMNTEQILSEIREANLSYLMLA